MEILTLNKFKQTYYYKTELIELCREYHLPTSGTKAELNQYLELYLTGTPAGRIQPVRLSVNVKRLTYEQLTLDTKVVGSGFCFNAAARKFFAEYFDQKNFSFKKEMAIIKRRAEVNHDTTLTIGGLLAEYQKLASPTNQCMVAEEATYQWNHFVRDFCQSPESSFFKAKMKVAAVLWQHCKQSKMPKKYTQELTNKYAAEIAQFKIKE
ncbi:MAG: SAP domain-containing protein [Liquorilactobacillus nagelii]|jgi:hypothetical protein|uniref:SAP domain-containing protein n=2 Tax=Liquorilactobacillus nagelii TaxID=82688 RepID=UPI002432CD91|nr:SAP domain-containing protein [Liquorilactobacillus nagelii]MCI1633987.1 SAP domain-containing protein [Liquorilactobacillus nagelii]